MSINKHPGPDAPNTGVALPTAPVHSSGNNMSINRYEECQSWAMTRINDQDAEALKDSFTNYWNKGAIDVKHGRKVL